MTPKDFIEMVALWLDPEGIDMVTKIHPVNGGEVAVFANQKTGQVFMVRVEKIKVYKTLEEAARANLSEKYFESMIDAEVTKGGVLMVDKLLKSWGMK